MTDLSKYIGIPWVYRDSDCWALFKLMTREIIGIELPDLNLPEKSSIKANSKIFHEEMESPRWIKTKIPCFGSAVVFYGNSNKAIHIGFAIDSRTVIHSMGSASTRMHSRCDKIRTLISKGLFKRYEFYNYID
jgi:hypothetical protein